MGIITKILWPNNESGDCINAIFLWLIIILLFIFFICFYTNKKKTWGKNWTDCTREKDIRLIEISAICERISSRREKWSLAFPGLSLVIGLLGTFIGIYLALDNASMALSNVSANNEETMKYMRKVVGSMGFLFQSSIYGVLGFIIMRMCSPGIEGKRLQWVIERAHKEIEKHKNDEYEEEKGRHEKILGALGNIGNSLGKDIQSALVNVFNDMSSKMQSAMKDGLKNLSDEMKESTAAMRLSMEKLTTLTNELRATAQTFSTSSLALEKSADDVGKSINAFNQSVQNTLASIKADFLKSIEDSSKTMTTKMTAASGKIAAGVDKMGAAVEKMSEANENSYKQIKDSVDKIKETAAGTKTMFDIALTERSGTKQLMEDLKKAIDNQLKAISGANLAIKSALIELAETFKAKAEDNEQRS
jgi:hypothetical protein